VPSAYGLSTGPELAREYLVDAEKELREWQAVEATGDYRETDSNGNPVDAEAERRHVASKIAEAERRRNEALLDVDSADVYDEG
jgi:hypothetical protein